MDRLTEIYFDEFGIKHARLKDNISKKTYRSYTWTPQEIANEKLAELEDFMEKNKCHSVGDLMLEFTISAVDKLNLKLTEEKLAEMKAKLEELKSVAEKENLQHFKLLNYDDVIKNLKQENDQLKQQLDEKDAEVQSWKDGTMVVKLGKLEEQLAEKDQAIEGLQEINQSLGQTCNNDAKEIERLRKQLAEKEKEISVLKAIIDKNKIGNFTSTTVCNAISEFYEPLVENLQNQTAIAELEKVVEFIKEYPHEPRYWDIASYIDQQIKELKGGK